MSVCVREREREGEENGRSGKENERKMGVG